MASNVVDTPIYVDSVQTRYLVEPLNAPTSVIDALDKFPDNVYTKSVDSHFVRFMTALLGPAGVAGYLRQILKLRLALEARGFQLFDLESFYGDPFSFGRILAENIDLVADLLPSAEWQTIRAQDAAYRSRALLFLGAVRLGNSPEGLRLVASSGTGQTCRITENYTHLFDAHSDSPLGIPYEGKTRLLNEFIITPSAEVSRTLQQVIHLDHVANVSSYTITYDGYTTSSLAANAHNDVIEAALGNLPSVGLYNVRVTVGAVPSGSTAGPVILAFTNRLANQALPTVKVQSDKGPVLVTVTSGSVDPSGERIFIPEADQHHMQTALDKLRSVNTIPTFNLGWGNVRPQAWSAISATTEYNKVLRFVTGAPGVPWPSQPGDRTHWIREAVEIEAPVLSDDLRQHYIGWHNVNTVYGYRDDVPSNYESDTTILKSHQSFHIGAFPEMRNVMPFFNIYSQDDGTTFLPIRALADYPEPLAVTNTTADGTALINDTYPIDYIDLRGIPVIKYRDAHFWSSSSRTEGIEYLELDLGSPQPVNFLAFEITRKPVQISIKYDMLGAPNDPTVGTPRKFYPAYNVIAPGIPSSDRWIQTVHYEQAQNPWSEVQAYFNDGKNLIYTRFIQIAFARMLPSRVQDRFLYDPVNNIETPWSIDVRNLRIGRNVAPSGL